MKALTELTLQLVVWLQMAGDDLRAGYRRGAALERGQGMVEYGLILALIAIAVVGVLLLLGPQVKGIFNDARDSITNARTVSQTP